MRILCFIIFSSFFSGLNAQVNSSVSPHQALSDSIENEHSSFSSLELPMEVLSHANKSLLVLPRLFTDISAGHELVYATGGGFLMSKSWGNKTRLICSPLFLHGDLPAFIGEKFDSMSVYPGSGKNWYHSAKIQGNLSVPLRLSIRLSNTFTITAANERTFIGDGYRSLLLSDQGSEYPYVSIEANMKQIRYRHQISRWRQQMPGGESQTKFAATHYLSWMLLKKLNISFFESVIWKASDSVRQRGFEWLYLNPVLFFRPAEFALGSPDNMLIGGNVSWNVLPKTKLYGQVLLDEFFVSEIKNWIRHLMHPNDPGISYGAWVNKQAFQLGLRSVALFGIDGLNALAEINFARPYVFSHRDPVLSYTHMNQPTAHPLGANFVELLGRTKYATKKWAIHLNAMYYQTGLDSTGAHFGQDLLQSTFDGPLGTGNIPVQYYGNHTGQGLKHDIMQVSIGYQRKFIFKDLNFSWRSGILYRNDHSAQNTVGCWYFFSGINLLVNHPEWDLR